MPERPLTMATYAAGASLAAITLVYVFGPTFFLDDEAANSSKSSRKKAVVGLYNPANDCFINSILQALAGLPELRQYLIRELHRRQLDGLDFYSDLTAAVQDEARNLKTKPVPGWKLLNLQQGVVTAGLKEVLDALNERPIYKKTISAQAFIRVIEQAFQKRINRSQQDAQEFLQLVAERLADEYHAGRKVRRRAVRHGSSTPAVNVDSGEAGQEKDDSSMDMNTFLDLEGDESEERRDSKIPSPSTETEPDQADSDEARPTPQIDQSPENENNNHIQDSDEGGNEGENEDENGDDEACAFPFEGKLESQVECSYCHFKPRAHVSSFVTLTLHVPQQSGATTLNACFDGMLKIENIDDFTCDRCRLEHALQVNATQLSKSKISIEERTRLDNDRVKLENAIQEDPEKPPKDVKLPELSSAPKRRISRHVRISSFPRVLAIHLSRSVWDPHAISTKNLAKVAFPETLPLGTLLDRKTYRLLSVVMHKGGHNSGHYESFRRQLLNPPYSTNASMGTEGIYSLRSSQAPTPNPATSVAPSPPSAKARVLNDLAPDSGPATPDSQKSIQTSYLDSPSGSSSLSTPPPSTQQHTQPLDRRKTPPAASIPFDALPTPGLPTPPLSRQSMAGSRRGGQSLSGAIGSRMRRNKGPDRWWRISDDRIKEAKTGDVLGMQREVYLLFYEMVDESEV